MTPKNHRRLQPEDIVSKATKRMQADTLAPVPKRWRDKPASTFPVPLFVSTRGGRRENEGGRPSMYAIPVTFQITITCDGSQVESIRKHVRDITQRFKRQYIRPNVSELEAEK